MNNEIKRKITSLTLMTIMLAGGMIAAVPSMVPAAHAANANLFVSAENSQFSNYMSGPQVIEVVVIDSDVNDTDEAKGEPDVTINGKKLRMAQAVDGNWYGYFADKTMAMIADSTTSSNARGNGLDFGTFCTAASALTYLGVSVSDTSGVAVPHYNSTTGSAAGLFGQNGTATGTETITGSCSTKGVSIGATGNAVTSMANGTDAMEVLREVKQLNIPAVGSAINIGQIGINGTKGVSTSTAAFWPFIQLYSLTVSGNVVIQYNKGGGTQTTTLTFDTAEQFAKAALDRSVYTTSSQVHLTVTDLWLNIDPTDEDSWTFGTQESNSTSFGSYYQVFDENGAGNGDLVTNGVNQLSKSTLQTMMTETNGLLRVDANTQSATNPVLTLQDNGDSNLSCSSVNSATTCLTTGANSVAGNELDKGSVPVTVTEYGPNSGIFATYDETDTSALIITSNAARGTSATLDYNEHPVTVLVGFGFATIDIAPTDVEWNSGEEIPLTLVDSDANRNSRADEDLDVNNPSVGLIPALKTGDPFTLGDGGSTTDVMFTNTGSSLIGSSAGTSLGARDAIFTFGAANRTATDWSVQSFSQRAIFTNATTSTSTFNALLIQNVTTIDELKLSIGDSRSAATNRLHGLNLLNLDVSSITSGKVDVYLLNSTVTATSLKKISSPATAVATPNHIAILLANDVNAKSLTSLNVTAINTHLFDEQTAAKTISFIIVANSTFTEDTANDPIVLDFFSYGFYDDGYKHPKG
ncbi:S-layer protein [Nitrosarchaeum sp.]|nr:S-layer protein [Nitrosarchaeum sp.]